MNVDIEDLQLKIIKRKAECKLRQLEHRDSVLLESEFEARIQELNWFLEILDKKVKK